MNRQIEPLTQEERELAERLARLDTRREPAPALDAAILAAARAAVAKPVAEDPPKAASETDDSALPPGVTAFPARKPKPTARWPLGLGLAASLVLAGGIGWRLSSNGDHASEMAQAPMAAAADAEEATEARMIDPPMNTVPPPPPPAMELAPQEQPRREVASVEAQKSMAKAAIDQPEAHDKFVRDEALPTAEADAAANAVAAAPPPPAEAEAAADASAASIAKPSGAAMESAARAMGSSADSKQAQATPSQQSVSGLASETRMRESSESKSERRKDQNDQTLDRIETIGSRQKRQQTPASAAAGAAAPSPTAASAKSSEANGTKTDDSRPSDSRPSDNQLYDNQPPVTADSPQFRQAWLQRIRDLLAKGKTEAAKTSMREFRRRYPDAELPEDLRKFAASLAPPAH